MSWAKVDDRANEHHKHLDAGPEACWFWVCGLMYANRQPDRNGFIPERALSLLYPVKNPKKLATKLVEVGLWDEVKGGFQIHNYHGWNPTTEQIEAERAAGRERAAKSYAGRKAKKPDSSPESSPEEKTKTPEEAGPKKRDSSGSTPTPLHSTPGEEDPPTPLPGPPRKPASEREDFKRFERTLGQPPASRPDVLRVFEVYKASFGLSGRTFRGPFDDDAFDIAKAIDSHSEADALLVGKHAPLDGMVSGRDDQDKAKHESIRYIFGNENTFSRILRDGTKREREQQGGGKAAARIRDLKSRDADDEVSA